MKTRWSLSLHTIIFKQVIKSMGIQNTRNERFQTEAINKRKSIEQSVQRFTVNTEIENGFWTMRVILQNLIPLSMAISTRTI